MKPTSSILNLLSRLALLLGIGCLLANAVPMALANITVANLDDSGPGSLRQAIADAAPGDTIDFAVTGAITLTSGELVVTNDLTIAGPGVTNLTVSGNDSSRVFSISNATVYISGMAATHGRAWGGGAVRIESTASLTLTHCSVTASYDIAADYSGGGGGIKNMGTLRGIDCAVFGNTGACGGGIWNVGKLDLINSSISANYGQSAGGGIWHAGSPSTLVNCTVSGNSVMWNGGGVMITGYATMTCSNCTITANDGWYLGGGIFLPTGGDTAILRNTILAGNTAVTGPDCSSFGLTSLDYNLIGNTNGMGVIAGITTHNIYGQDPKLGPLTDNGGLTMTHALLPGSPAIDHGSSGGLVTDQRGLPRSFNFPAYFDADDASDIGAYELQERAQTGPVFTVNTTDDVDDGLPGIAHCSLREAIHAANANSDSNSIIFAASVPGVMNGVTGTIVLTSGPLSIGGWGGYDLCIMGPGASNLTISGNNASGVFGKAYCTAAISGLTIADGNTGLGNGGGAGIINGGGTMLVSDCIVSNCVSGMGGGVHNADQNASAGFLTLVRCTITRNASFYGGGVANTAQLYVSDSTICSNISYRYGGGLFNGWNAWLTNCTVSGNTLAGEAVAGGGIFGGFSYVNWGSYLLLANCTVASNGGTNSQSAGGIFSANPLSPVRLNNTIIAGNSAIVSPDCAGPFDSLDYNLIQNTNGCVITGTNTHDLYDEDPLLGPLADNGGPTLTRALRFDSPAIDAGDSNSITTDQRGMPRPVDGNGDAIAAFDIGACEFIPVPPTITNQPVTQTISPNGQATFTVGDAGNPPATYQWYFGGTLIPGATGSTLTITNAGPGQVGCYTVAVTNFAGGFVSSPACLWLNSLKMYAGVNVYGPVGGHCTVQYATNLANNPVEWVTLTNVTIQSAPEIVIDYGSGDQSQRFYRTVPMP